MHRSVNVRAGVVWGTLCLAALLLVGACQRDRGETPTRPSQALLRPSFEMQADHLGEMEGLAKRTRDRFVWIDANDIELPQSTGSQELTDHRNYTFSVFAYDPKSMKSLDEQLRDGDLQIEVLGAPASMRVAAYPTAVPEAAVKTETVLVAADSADNPVRRSHSVVHVTVRSQDLTRSINVVACYQRQYEEFERLRRSRIRTLQDSMCRLDMTPCDSRACPDRALGLTDYDLKLEEVIAEPNPYGEIRTIRVFNGDLQTRINLISRDEVVDAFGPTFEKYFFVGRCRFMNKHAAEDLVIYTTSMAAKCLFYRLPNKELARYFLQTCDNGKRFEYAKRYSPLIWESPEKQGLTRTGLNGRQVTAIGNVSAKRAVRDFTDSGSPPEPDAEAIVREALPADAASLSLDQQAEAQTIARLMFTSSLTAYRGLDAEKTSDAYYNANAAVIRSQVRHFFAGTQPKRPADPEVQARADELVRGLQPRLDAVVANATDKLLSNGSPVSHPLPVWASPTHKKVAYSPYIFRQGALAATGYLFEDFYRPMTFRAVLTSLYEKTTRRDRAQVLDFLDSLGAIAGALVGIDPFDSKGFDKGVAIGTGIVLPEMRKRLLDDVEQYVKNLEKMALDNVFVLKPGEQQDGYVFFPKGPIFGFGIDEFTVDCPTYLVNIDSVDVSVEARLIHEGENVLSGETSSQVAAEFLDSGRKQRSEAETKVLKLKANARNMELQDLKERIEGLTATGNEKDYQVALHLIAARKNKYVGDQDALLFLEELEGEVRAKMGVPFVKPAWPVPDVVVGVKGDPIAVKIEPSDLADLVTKFEKTDVLRLPDYLLLDESTGSISFAAAAVPPKADAQFVISADKKVVLDVPFAVKVTFRKDFRNIQGKLRLVSPLAYGQPISAASVGSTNGVGPGAHGTWAGHLAFEVATQDAEVRRIVDVDPAAGVVFLKPPAAPSTGYELRPDPKEVLIRVTVTTSDAPAFQYLIPVTLTARAK